MSEPKEPINRKDGELYKSPKEIERKFVVTAESLQFLEGSPNDYEYTSIRQGYLVLGSDGSEARVRDASGIYSLTVKSKGDLVRGEWEVVLDEVQFAELWPASKGKRVEKTRFKILHEDSLIELDIYEGDLVGLMTAEVEFQSEEAARRFRSPAWLGAEVTSNKAFKNQNLAVHGIPQY